jgi:hypothetical protein
LGIVALMMVDEERTTIGNFELHEAGPVPDTTWCDSKYTDGRFKKA